MAAEISLFCQGCKSSRQHPTASPFILIWYTSRDLTVSGNPKEYSEYLHFFVDTVS